MHYQRAVKHGDPLIKLSPRPQHLPDGCSIAGCEGSYHSNGLCVTHWGRKQRLGDPNAPVLEQIKGGASGSCKTAGCTEPAVAKKLCQLHYGRKHMREYRRAHYAANKPAAYGYWRKRRDALRAATPPWVEPGALRAVYTKCPPGMEVDHVVPVQGENVCGLNVPWNLQYLTREQNRRKGRKF